MPEQDQTTAFYQNTSAVQRPNIRAKLKCLEVTKTEYGENAKLTAVHGNGEENKSFSEATPVANHEMTITNKAAHGYFVPGKEYYLDFTPA